MADRSDLVDLDRTLSSEEEGDTPAAAPFTGALGVALGLTVFAFGVVGGSIWWAREHGRTREVERRYAVFVSVAAGARADQPARLLTAVKDWRREAATLTGAPGGPAPLGPLTHARDSAAAVLLPAGIALLRIPGALDVVEAVDLAGALDDVASATSTMPAVRAMAPALAHLRDSLAVVGTQALLRAGRPDATPEELAGAATLAQALSRLVPATAGDYQRAVVQLSRRLDAIVAGAGLRGPVGRVARERFRTALIRAFATSGAAVHTLALDGPDGDTLRVATSADRVRTRRLFIETPAAQGRLLALGFRAIRAEASDGVEVWALAPEASDMAAARARQDFWGTP